MKETIEYHVTLTEEEHRFIEKQIDKLRSENLGAFNQMVMDGQFRAGSNKLLSDEENKTIKSAFTKLVAETLRAENMLAKLQKKLEDGYKC